MQSIDTLTNLKPVALSDFKPGRTAWVVRPFHDSKGSHVYMTEVFVEKVGRKYVTAGRTQYSLSDDPLALYTYETKLCPDKTYAEAYLLREALYLKFRRMRPENYGIDALSKAMLALEPGICKNPQSMWDSVDWNEKKPFDAREE